MVRPAGCAAIGRFTRLCRQVKGVAWLAAACRGHRAEGLPLPFACNLLLASCSAHTLSQCIPGIVPSASITAHAWLSFPAPLWHMRAVPIYDSLGESAVDYIINHSGKEQPQEGRRACCSPCAIPFSRSPKQQQGKGLVSEYWACASPCIPLILPASCHATLSCVTSFPSAGRFENMPALSCCGRACCGSWSGLPPAVLPLIVH